MSKFDIVLSNGTSGSITVLDKDGPNFGREGTVLLTSDRASCVKCFRQDGSINLIRKMNKTHLMLAKGFDEFRTLSNRRTNATALGGFGWPTFAAFDPSLRSRDNRLGFVGYGMPYLANTETLSRLHVSSNKLSQDAGLRDRLHISAIISFLFAFVHGNRICIGDARPENIRIRQASPGQWQAFVIDTDSFQIAKPGVGQRRYFTSDGGHDDYSSPRLLRKVIARPQDGYRNLKRVPADDIHALAVICFQNLLRHHPLRTTGNSRPIHQNAVDNIFPYAGGPFAPNKNAPTEEYRALPEEIRVLFEDAFLRENYAPARRWMEAFDRHAKLVPDLVPRQEPVPPPEPIRSRPKAVPPSPPPPPTSPTAIKESVSGYRSPVFGIGTRLTAALLTLIIMVGLGVLVRTLL